MATRSLRDLARAIRMLHRSGSRQKEVSTWTLASIPHSNRVHLLLDGFLSVGGDGRGHIADLHKKYVLREADDPAVAETIRGHTYDPRAYHFITGTVSGSGYLAEDTYPPIESHVRTLVRALEVAAPGSVVVVTGYSMGSVIATLALWRLLNKTSSLHSSLPKLILLEPVLQSPSRLLEALLQSEESPFSSEEIPQAILDLCNDDAEGFLSIPTRTANALIELINKGISVSIIHFSGDEFVPYIPIPDKRIDHDPTPATAFSEDGQIDGIRAHFDVRTIHYNHDSVYQKSKMLLDP